MIVLALLGLLALPAPDAGPRVPGMRLRLGMAESSVLALGSFPEVKAQDAGTLTARQGPGRFFGLPGKVTCYLGDGRLDHVKFEADSVSRHSQDYVDGQLRRMRFERGCVHDDPGNRVCTWVGPSLRVSTEMKKDRLVARIESWPPREAHPADSLRAASPAPASVTRAPARGAGATTPAPSLPAAVRPPPPTPTASTTPKPPVAATRPDTAARKPAATITLPETLTISLVSRNSPDVWPRIVSSPQLHYPEEARRESVQGVVWVLALVDPTGRVLDAWVERGLPELDTAALSWVSRSRFAPCERNGAPCRFHVRVAVLFTLH